MGKPETKPKISDIPCGAVVIIGAGHFGNRAARLLSRRVDASMIVVDIQAKQLDALSDLAVRRILRDGVQFLADNFSHLKPATTIVPALPIHLAFEWLKAYYRGQYLFKTVELPRGAISSLPQVWHGKDGSCLVSYADFLCPDDCPEPIHCTVTDERREQPMYELLGNLALPDFRVHVIRSHQLAPGLGGYTVQDLRKAKARIMQEKGGNWVLATACSCHGVVTAFQLEATCGKR